RPGARGRITAYGLRIDRVLEDTRPAWANVGEDFQARMGMSLGEAPQQGAVVAFPGRTPSAPPDLSRGDVWSLAQGLLYAEDTQSYGAWLGALSVHRQTGDRLLLMAPSRFHAHYVQTHLLDRVTRAVRSVESGVDRVALLYPGSET
uniref:DnaA N-terminal domain-containing protein n=2 Tax=Puniceibacterium confluentis TaxID=1958944 RepID=UPI003562E453